MRLTHPLARRAERGLLVLLMIVTGLVSTVTLASGITGAASQAKAATAKHTFSAQAGHSVQALALRQTLSSSSYPLNSYDAIGSHNLTYHNGPVIRNPDVKLIFEGSSWTASQMQTVKQYFLDVSGSSFEGILSQYPDSMGPISTTITVSGSVQDPNYNQTHLCSSGGPEILDTGLPTSPLGDPNNIYDEIQKETTANNWSMTSSIFFVFPPSGATVFSGNCSTQRCGYHSSFTTDSGITNTIYAVIPWGGGPCNGSFPSGTDPVQIDINTASHEQFEAITNPTWTILQPNGGGWYDEQDNCGTSTNPSLCEIGDKCQDAHPGIFLNGHYYSVVQGEYSNATDSCEYPAPPPVVDVPSGGAFYTVWQSFGGATGVLGDPIDSWYSVNGGQAQDFQGGSIDWSSATGTYEVHGAIYSEYANMSGPNGVLNFPTSNVLAISGGYVSYFYGVRCGGVATGPYNSGSAIYNSSAGTHEIQGCVYAKYQQLGGPGSALKYPVSDENIFYNSSGSRIGWGSYFAGVKCGNGGPNGSGSAIYVPASNNSASGGHEVQGCVFTNYQRLGGPTGILGFPISDENTFYNSSGSRVGWGSYFAGQVCGSAGPDGSGSAIYVPASNNSASGGHEVHGCIYNKYWHLNGPTGMLGFPVTDEQAIASGHVSYFAGQSCNGGGPNGSGSAIYFLNTTIGGHEVHGCIYHAYTNFGGPSSSLGFPTSDEYTNSSGQRESDFQGGNIIWWNGQAYINLTLPGCGTVSAMC